MNVCCIYGGLPANCVMEKFDCCCHVQEITEDTVITLISAESKLQPHVVFAVRHKMTAVLIKLILFLMDASQIF